MRLLIGLLLLAFALLQLRLWFSDSGLPQARRLQQQVRLQSGENHRLAERNAALEAEVLDLKRGHAAAEERARSELGMVRRDETFYEIAPYSASEAK